MKSNLRLISGKALQSPKGLKTRPTTSRIREAVINILREDLKDSHWLDLCSGSGIMSCEALNMGARRIFSVESNKQVSRVCKLNLISTASDVLHKNHLDVVTNEVVSTLEKGCKNQSTDFIRIFPNENYRFDLAYIDPPYQSGLYSLILDNLVIGDWLKKNATVICEKPKTLDIDISSKWLTIKKKNYGGTTLLFLTPNQALHYCDDTDSKLLQKDPK